MSGICGIVNFDGRPVDPELLKRMAEAAAYRGPDGITYWIKDNVGFAHLALHTTPESVRERQPLVNRRGDVVLTADARVDNRHELIRTLTAKGHLQRKDSTDADLIMAAYECWGEDCPKHIVGDYALAIWDAARQRLYCARDALGQKAFHYSRQESCICLASEAQQLVQHPMIPSHLDETTAADYLVASFFEQERTMFVDVHRLIPGHRLVATYEKTHRERYWDVEPTTLISYNKEMEYAEHFLDLFCRAVNDRLRTQCKTIGILMSGGLDSSSVAATAQRLLPNRSQLVAFSYVFEHSGDCDERTYSDAMASELGIEIEHIEAERSWLLENREAFQPDLEMPFVVWEAPLARQALCRLQRREGRVIMSGHGGDSFLGGSPLTCLDRILRGQVGVVGEIVSHARKRDESCVMALYRCFIAPILPRVLVRAKRRLLNQGSRHCIPSWIMTDSREQAALARRLTNPPTAPHWFQRPALRSICQKTASLGVIGYAVYWYDQAASRFGIEARHPFLDRRVAEFLRSIPPEQVYRGVGERKLILRQAMKGILPETIRLRKDKTRFTSFIDSSLRIKAANQIDRLLEAPKLGDLGLVHPEGLRQAYHSYQDGKTDDPSRRLWFTLMLELWLGQYCPEAQIREHLVRYGE